MLSGKHFYHRITRKLVVAFGTAFNNIRLYRYDKAGTTEIERVTVPLTYASKEKFYTRFTQDPNLAKEVEVVLPRMSFHLTAITYDPTRKTTSHIDEFAYDNNKVLKKVKKTPYNFEFELNIYVRNVEDGAQIVEQILPYFNPDYTVTIDVVNLPELKHDVPIIFNNISMVEDYVGGSDTTRVINWNLTFTAKGYLFGAVDDVPIIREVFANTYLDRSPIYKNITVGAGTGEYKVGELVIQGRDYEEATFSAFVSAWSNSSNSLIITEYRGEPTVNAKVRGVVTGATYVLDTISDIPNKLVSINIKPDPLTANADDDFGYTETMTEYY